VDINNIKPDETLDCVGLGCPMPILKTTQKIKEMQPGQVLDVLADDEGLQRDMPAWCKRTGHEYLGTREENGEYHVYVRKR
jgi:tRNA 2-thiouridine synthesizing protein A